MPKLRINGISVEVEPGTTVLESIRFLGLPIPTLCHDDGLRDIGACRLCVVEVSMAANGRTRLLSACTLPAQDGMNVRTNSATVQKARKLLLELYVATCPQSKRIQDLASEYGVRQCRYETHNEHCIQCGLCVRICEQQMMGKVEQCGNQLPLGQVAGRTEDDHDARINRRLETLPFAQWIVCRHVVSHTSSRSPHGGGLRSSVRLQYRNDARTGREPQRRSVVDDGVRRRVTPSASLYHHDAGIGRDTEAVP